MSMHYIFRRRMNEGALHRGFYFFETYVLQIIITRLSRRIQERRDAPYAGMKTKCTVFKC